MTSLRDILVRSGASLTPSETKIVRILLSDYPMSGLGTASALARRAGVSDPTVVRLMAKLGLGGFSDFQARLLEEVEARLRSPLLMMEAKRAESAGGADAYLESAARAVEETRSSVPAETYERAGRLLAECRGTVAVLGGRFSRNLASMLASYLAQLRRGVLDIARLSPDDLDRLIDLDRRDVLVVFDYRRYQSDVIDFAAQAAARGVPIVLFTDPWLSPIARHAEIVLVAKVEVTSPFDTLAPALAQMEAVVLQGLGAAGARGRERIGALEAIRSKNAVTIDAPQDGHAGAAATAATAATATGFGRP